MTELELQLVSTEELSKELAKRFDGIIVYGIQKKTANEVSTYYDHYAGDQATLIGLCELMKDKLIEDYKNNTINEGEK